MQDTPLTTNWIFDRGEQYFGDEDRRHEHRRRAASPRPSPTSPTRRAAIAAALDALGVSDRRPGGDLRVEHRAPPGAVLRHSRHRPGHAHGEHPLLPRTADLHGQPRRGRGGLRRPVAAAAVRQVPARARRPSSMWSSWTTAPTPSCPTTRASSVTRTSSAAPSRSTSPTGSSDERQGAAICYTTGTTGNPKGVLLQPSLDVAALERGADHLDVRAARARPHPAGRPDVPRQRVGAAVRRVPGRRLVRDARARTCRRRRWSG